MQPNPKTSSVVSIHFPGLRDNDDDSHITITMSIRHLFAFFFYAKHGMDLVDRNEVLGDDKLGDACDLVPNASVTARPATSLAEVKPDCTVHVAARRSRWSVRLPCPQRTRHEQLLAACMRDGKQRKLSACRKVATRRVAERAFVKLCDLGLLRDVFQAKSKVTHKMFDIIVTGGQTLKLPVATIADVKALNSGKQERALVMKTQKHADFFSTASARMTRRPLLAEWRDETTCLRPHFLSEHLNQLLRQTDATKSHCCRTTESAAIGTPLRPWRAPRRQQ